MNEQENTKLVKRVYELFKSGDVEGFLNMFSDDVSWETPMVKNSPFGGKISGREKVAEFMTNLDEHEEFTVFETTEFTAQGNKVVVLGHSTARVKSTNKELTLEFAHIVTVADGKITGFLEFFDNAAAEKAYTSAQAA